MSMLPVIPQQQGVQPTQPVQEQRPPIDRQALGFKLNAELAEAQKARSAYELRWLEDLRQYKGTYSPSIRKRLKENQRSQVFYRYTTAKTNTMIARLMDLLFPQRSKNWAINATPDPSIPQDMLAQDMAEEINAAMQAILMPLMQQMAAQNIIPDELAIQKLTADAYQQAIAQIDTPENRQRVATERAQRMETLIDDQLKESNANGMRRPAWAQNCRSVVHDACVYGMGILKGPLVEKVQLKRFVSQRDFSGQTFWREEIHAEELRPYHEAVSIWDVFPDPDARTPEDLRYVWQCHLMSDKDVKELRTFPGFDRAAIEKHLRDHDEGDASLESWEAQLRNLDEDSTGTPTLVKRYRVWERWGFLTGKELADAGADISSDRYTEVYSSNVWMIGDNTVIKAMVNPLEGVDIPYYWYPYERDDSTFWPEGIPSLLRHPQSAINAAVRAMQDNAAVSATPILAFNMQALSAQDAADVNAAMSRKMFRFDRAGLNMSQAFQAVVVPSNINENMALQTFWNNVGDEISTPRFNAGDGNVAGAGKTASGLSMLMGASNILLKDHIKLFDDCVVGPFIRAMYRWNMQWSGREDCKGDFEIVASGSQSLIAKEVRAQQIPLILSYLADPSLAVHINKRGLLEVALEQTDLPVERILFTEEEADRHQLEQQQMAAQANVKALTQQLQAQGMTPEQINQQILILLAQLQGQAPVPEQALPPSQPQQPQPGGPDA